MLPLLLLYIKKNLLLFLVFLIYCTFYPSSQSMAEELPDFAQSEGETMESTASGFGNAGSGLGATPNGYGGDGESGREANEGGDEETGGDDVGEKTGNNNDESAEDDAEVAAQTLDGGDTAGLVPKAEAPKEQIPEVLGNGTLGYSFALDLPGYRGLEPRIALTYASSRKTMTGGIYQGWLGYGWGLSGFDVVERASQNGNVPEFDVDDVYLLNGVELVPCVTGTVSPSCDTGGTHATENESYLRIRQDTSANTWTITGKNGTKTVLQSVGAIAGETTAAPGTDEYDVNHLYRWLVKSIIDTHGNQVNYAYTCLELPVCYPSTVTYNGTTATFYMEDRPDYILMANGHTISETTRRIRTISVTANSNLRTAYTLEYDNAPISNSSRLIRIRQFGTDTVLDSVGAATEGTERPAVELEYADYSDSRTEILFERTTGTVEPSVLMGPVDLNNDGKSSLARSMSAGQYTNPDKRCNLLFTTVLNGTVSDLEKPLDCISASFLKSPINYLISKIDSLNNNKITLYLTKIKAQTQSSFLTENHVITDVYHQDVGQETKCPNHSVSSTNSDCEFLTPTPSANYWNAFDTSRSIIDTDGDGHDELHLVPYSSSRQYGRIGAGRILSGKADGVLYYNKTLQKLEFIGRDNSIEIVDVINMYGVLTNATCLSIIGINHCHVVDINGDGLLDLVKIFPNLDWNGYYQRTTYHVYLSTGDRFVFSASGVKSFGPYGTRSMDYRASGFATDVDGDGKQEFAQRFQMSSSLLNVSTAGRYYKSDYLVPSVLNVDAQSASLDSAAGISPIKIGGIPWSSSVDFGGVAGDFNGDGLMDTTINITECSSYLWVHFLCPVGRGDTNQERHFSLSIPGTALPNLLTSVTSQLGGTASFEYTPSTAWDNDFLPHVLPTLTKLSIDDGRGQVAETTYTYEGGLYDPAARKFLGFKKITETQPLAAGQENPTTVETTYRQDLASYGLVEQVLVKDGAGTVRKQIDETWIVQLAAKPYTALNTKTETMHTEGSVSKTLTMQPGSRSGSGVNSTACCRTNETCPQFRCSMAWSQLHSDKSGKGRHSIIGMCALAKREPPLP